MKVILSRKGFDSANGGIPSPIFEDGTMLSFPIPSKDHNMDKISYNELTCNGVLLNKILKDLGYSGDECCHLDPDLDSTRRVVPVKGWKPAFGQINQSASYLLNNKIDEGDLFLFFGNFRHVVESEENISLHAEIKIQKIHTMVEKCRLYGDIFRLEKLYRTLKSKRNFSGTHMLVIKGYLETTI